MSELIDTEQSYIQDMAFIVKVGFVLPLVSQDKV